MTKKFYTRNKLTQIILDLIYLYQEMDKDGHVDHQSMEYLDETIANLKYYLQFLEKDK